jgi:hypothetical protein
MKIMDFKKIFTSKIGIAIVFVAITILAILGFNVICKRGGSYMFRDRRGNTKVETVVDKDVIDVEDSIVVYDYYKENSDGKSTDKYFKCNGSEYHIVVNASSVNVNDLEIYRSNNGINSVYLIKDIVAILYNYHDLVFVDMSGNILKKIDNTYNFVVNGTEVATEVDNYVVRDDEIFEYHKYDKVSFSYLGEGKFSDFNVVGKGSAVAATPNTCFDDRERCLLYDKNGIRIESSWDDDRQNWGAIVSVNGKPVKLDGYRIDEIKFTNDKYLYISGSSGTGNGRPAFFLIADLNGNIITKMDERSLVDVDMYNYSTYFGDGKIVYDAVQEGSSVDLVCEKMLGINEFDSPVAIKSYDDIAYVKNEYNYIGNGKVSRVNRVEKTFGNYMKELTGYDNCQDAINNIDSWKSKDDIYKFYGVK